MFGRKKTEKKTYDREKLRPVLKCSICNGEQVAGFREIQTGRFQEVMFIRNEKDLEEFLRTYDLSEIDREY
ncbi:MAG TPA: aspartate dehydrogenase [Candidatus Blautia gallistercoris]|uniref:Aspartate dehydrogenase n=1 Tax=Candidatus Blautia gallistercoris TaxID=2838490 RepID=A0A9D2B3H9_9FIRM|nr:aspartate dehydrogenase [Candidatus Blautia gallistercoris]